MSQHPEQVVASTEIQLSRSSQVVLFMTHLSPHILLQFDEDFQNLVWWPSWRWNCWLKIPFFASNTTGTFSFSFIKFLYCFLITNSVHIVWIIWDVAWSDGGGIIITFVVQNKEIKEISGQYQFSIGSFSLSLLSHIKVSNCYRIYRHLVLFNWVCNISLLDIILYCKLAIIKCILIPHLPSSHKETAWLKMWC